MIVTINEKSGFCWGVVRTIDIAESVLNEKNNNAYILGKIIHNSKEVERLANLGLKTINHSDFENIAKNEPNATVIIRAHGEPPSTYKQLDNLNINYVDATCPLVTNLQNRVRKYYEQGFQIIIFGKKEHPEVIGLRGVCNDECVVIRSLEEAYQINDFSKKTVLMSQTTMDKHIFHQIEDYLKSKIKNLLNIGYIDINFLSRDTTCRAVTSREEPLKQFAKENDILIFVSGKDSSNGKALFNTCLKENPKSYFIEDLNEIDWNWFENVEKVGITGATSTPMWLMEKIKKAIEDKFN
jgi:4-hydroxy-3-methylbut-2-enyl diphosphate reductase